jgi:hypothetical protein
VTPTLTLPRIGRKYVHIAVTATRYDRSPATITGVQVALLPPDDPPDADTVWHPAVFDEGDAVLLVEGPDAEPSPDPIGAVAVPVGELEVWVRIVDHPEIDATAVGRLRVT